MKTKPHASPAPAALDIDEAALIADLDAMLEREGAEMNAALDELIWELEAEPDPKAPAEFRPLCPCPALMRGVGFSRSAPCAPAFMG